MLNKWLELMLKKYPHITIFFYIQSAGLDDASANKFKQEILQQLKLAKGLEYALMVVGAVVAGSVLIFSLAKFIVNSVSFSES